MMKTCVTRIILAMVAATGTTIGWAQAPLPETAADLGLMQGAPPPEDRLVTRANWMAAPFNRWAFQHADRLFPTHSFRRDAGPEPLPAGNPVDLDVLEVQDVDGTPLPLSTFLQKYYTDAFLVLHRGRVVHERYWNGMTPAQPHQLFSITKSFTGALVHQLVERGVIDMNATVATYVPELAESAFGDATVRQMMDMQVAAFWDESPEAAADPKSTFSQYATAVGFIAGPELTSAYGALRIFEKKGEHGRVFNYVAPVTDALGWLIERVTGKTYGEQLDAEILSKIGLEGRGYIVLDPWGKALSTGGLNLTARDLARFGLAVSQGGRLGDRMVVSQPYVDDSRYGGDRDAFRKGGEIGAFLPGGAYRNQWWVTPGEQPRLMGLGVFGQNLYINAEAEVVIVRLASLPTTFGKEDPVIWKAYDRIANELSGPH